MAGEAIKKAFLGGLTQTSGLLGNIGKVGGLTTSDNTEQALGFNKPSIEGVQRKGLITSNKSTLLPIAETLQKQTPEVDEKKMELVKQKAKSNGYNDEQTNKLIEEVERKSPGYFNKELSLGQDLSMTVGKGLQKVVNSAEDYESGKITGIEDTLTKIGAPVNTLFGAVGDVAEHTPVVGTALEYLGKGIQMIPGVKQAGEAYAGLQESNPRLTNQLENIGGVASIIPVGGLVGKVAKSIPDVGEIKAGVSEGVSKSKQFIKEQSDEYSKMSSEMNKHLEDVNLSKANLSSDDLAIRMLDPSASDFDTIDGKISIEGPKRALSDITKIVKDDASIDDMAGVSFKEKERIWNDLNKGLSAISETQIPVKYPEFRLALQLIDKVLQNPSSSKFIGKKERVAELLQKNEKEGLTTIEQYEINRMLKDNKRLFADGEARGDTISLQDAMALSDDLMGKVAERIPVKDRYIFGLLNEYGDMADAHRLLVEHAKKLAVEAKNISPETYSKWIARFMSRIPILKGLNTAALQDLARESRDSVGVVSFNKSLPAFIRLMQKQNVPKADIKKYTDLYKEEFKIIPQLTAGKEASLSASDSNITPRTGYSKGVPLDGSELKNTKIGTTEQGLVKKDNVPSMKDRIRPKVATVGTRGLLGDKLKRSKLVEPEPKKVSDTEGEMPADVKGLLEMRERRGEPSKLSETNRFKELKGLVEYRKDMLKEEPKSTVGLGEYSESLNKIGKKIFDNMEKVKTKKGLAKYSDIEGTMKGNPLFKKFVDTVNEELYDRNPNGSVEFSAQEVFDKMYNEYRKLKK